MAATTIEDRAPSGRATSLKAFRAIMGPMETPEGIALGLGMTLLPTDIDSSKVRSGQIGKGSNSDVR